jgi:hypothetical protein
MLRTSTGNWLVCFQQAAHTLRRYLGTPRFMVRIGCLKQVDDTSRGNSSGLEHGDFPAAYIVDGGTDSQLLLLYQVG